jgi:hypothetical protein
MYSHECSGAAPSGAFHSTAHVGLGNRSARVAAITEGRATAVHRGMQEAQPDAVLGRLQVGENW